MRNRLRRLRRHLHPPRPPGGPLPVAFKAAVVAKLEQAVAAAEAQHPGGVRYVPLPRLPGEGLPRYLDRCVVHEAAQRANGGDAES